MEVSGDGHALGILCTAAPSRVPPNLVVRPLSRKRSASLGSLMDLSASLRLSGGLQSKTTAMDMFADFDFDFDCQTEQNQDAPISSSQSRSRTLIPTSYSQPNLKFNILPDSHILSAPSPCPQTIARTRTKEDSFFDLSAYVDLDGMDDVAGHTPQPPAVVDEVAERAQLPTVSDSSNRMLNPPASYAGPVPLTQIWGTESAYWTFSSPFNVTEQERALERALGLPQAQFSDEFPGQVRTPLPVTVDGSRKVAPPPLSRPKTPVPRLRAASPSPSPSKRKPAQARSKIPRTRSQPLVTIKPLEDILTIPRTPAAAPMDVNVLNDMRFTRTVVHAPTGVEASNIQSSAIPQATLEEWKQEVARRKEQLAEMKRVTEWEAREAHVLLEKLAALRRKKVMEGQYSDARDRNHELIAFKNRLDAASAGKGRHSLMRRTAYYLPVVKEDIYSYSVPDESQYKRGGKLPSNARGIFMRMKDGAPQIVARGYDKFFNVGEVKWVEWTQLQEATLAPYELTLKENGCIIFIAALDGHILVTSKHAIGGPHAEKGEEWLLRHLNRAGRTKQELARFLEGHNVTAVFELADDEFEEHILAYPPDRAGLYLHGINHNTIRLQTWPTSQLTEFANYFGFNQVGALVRDTIEQVKELTDSCRETGSFENRPIEGWVVRCKVRGEDRELEDMFFKVKYDEPYLMYREWREVTRQVMRGKDFARHRYDLTSKYVNFVKRKLKEEPILFEGFNQNHGIIRVRNMFLAEMGINDPERLAVRNDIDGEESTHTAGLTPEVLEARAMNDNGNASTASGSMSSGLERGSTSDHLPSPAKSKPMRGYSKTIIVPIATIGCGKTTLAVALTELFGFGHVQNDNITNKKNPMKHFVDAIFNEFKDHDTVIADKNNHLFEHRQNLIASMRNQYPGCRVIALDWQVDPAQEQEILEVTTQRVISRGENHQSLTPNRTEGFQKVLRNFIRKRDPIDLSKRADKGIDKVISLSVFSDTRSNLVTVIREMGLEMPTDEAIDQAMLIAFAYKPTVVKSVGDQKGKKTENKGRTALPRYYGIAITEPDLPAELARLFENREERSFWDFLVKKKRVKKDFHVTLVFCGNSAEQSRLPSDRIGLVEQYRTLLDSPSTPQNAGASASESPTAVTLTASTVVFNDRVMCIPVELPAGFESENAHPHITIATKDDQTKPVESNELLNRLAGSDGASDRSVMVVAFEQPLQLKGNLKAFWY
ncbi:hypothetical protein HDU93_008539 [Gonapodya sp. JEL0774]|nr:hypothetical protein HDU93_008539 [Gonapodya sp. JEL0774]